MTETTTWTIDAFKDIATGASFFDWMHIFNRSADGEPVVIPDGTLSIEVPSYVKRDMTCEVPGHGTFYCGFAWFCNQRGVEVQLLASDDETTFKPAEWFVYDDGTGLKSELVSAMSLAKAERRVSEKKEALAAEDAKFRAERAQIFAMFGL